MIDADIVCIWIAEIVPLLATLFSLIYGLRYFFKKGKPLFLQSLTMAMASHSLGSIYHIYAGKKGYHRDICYDAS